MAVVALKEPRLRSGSFPRRNTPVARIGKPSKAQEVYEALARLAQDLGPDAKLPTVLQLRDRLGVSVTTLNTVLAELEMRQIVRRRHGVGIYVASKVRQHRICLICAPSFLCVAGVSPFWRILVDHVSNRAESEREMLSFHFATDARFASETSQEEDGIVGSPLLPSSLIEDIRQGRVDGILGIGVSPDTTQWIENQGVPYVAFAGPGKYRVSLNEGAIVSQGASCLVEENCRRIGYWTAVTPYRYYDQGVTSHNLPRFKETLVSRGVPFHSELVCDNAHLIAPTGGLNTVTHQEQGYHTGMKIFGPHTDPAQWPDSILSGDDMVTVGLLTALQRAGVTVGEKVKIATHANAGSPVLLGWEDRLIRLEVNPAEIVNGMFDILESLMYEEEPAEHNREIMPVLRQPGDFQSEIVVN